MEIVLDPTVYKIILAAGYLLAGLVAGIVLEKVVIGAIARVARRTRWQGDEIVVGSLRGMVLLWTVLAALYVALLVVPVPPGLRDVAARVILVAAIFSVTVVVMRVAAGFVRLYADRAAGVLPTTSLFVNVTRLVVLITGVLIILELLGISITPVLTALGVGGLAVALALQDTLANFFAGIHIIISRQVRVGDYVRLDTGDEGYVTDLNWRYTVIRTLGNNVVVVPNGKLASAVVTNYDLPEKELSVLVDVGVSYASDLEKVERVTVEVAREVMREVVGEIPGFEPFIRYKQFGDSSVNFTAILRAKVFADQYPLKHEFIKRLHRRYAEEGIEIPFPIRTVYLRREQRRG
ncbi:MAG: mechanosensitive ion channel family protein [Desulfotomaculales bacterium]